MSSVPARQRLPRSQRLLGSWVAQWNRVGTQTAFFLTAIGRIPEALGRYRVETLRALAQMTFGVGSLAALGGIVVVVILIQIGLASATGAIAHKALGYVGIEALAGFFGSVVQTRLETPFGVNAILSATIGAGTTAQLGAMRINEEIDALDVMGVRTITYLVSTRLVAAGIAVIPLFCLALLMGWLAYGFALVTIFGNSGGAYDHYFQSFLNPNDVLRAGAQCVVTAFLVMAVHTYYGFTASGGPAGVGEAVGRAVRLSLILSMAGTLLVAMAVYGRTADFNLTG